MLIQIGVIVAIVAVCLGVFVVPQWVNSPGDPETVVEDFFDALASKDIEGALGYVEADAIPTGTDAAFLDGRAVSSGWKLVSTKDAQYDDSYGDDPSDATVDFTIGGEDGTAAGTVLVRRDYEAGWQLADPFVRVTIDGSPLDYAQLNGFIPAPQAIGDADEWDQTTPITLLPGLYRFYQDKSKVLKVKRHESIAVLPHDTLDDDFAEPSPVDIDGVSAGPRLVKKTRELLVDAIDVCAGQTVQHPYRCPFGTRDYVDYQGHRVEHITDLSWKVDHYPSIDLATPDPSQQDGAPPRAGFAVVSQKAGKMELRGNGVDTGGKAREFSVLCDIDTSWLSVRVNADADPSFDYSAYVGYNDGGYGMGDLCTRGGGS
jgi:hypothetical protein